MATTLIMIQVSENIESALLIKIILLFPIFPLNNRLI